MLGFSSPALWIGGAIFVARPPRVLHRGLRSRRVLWTRSGRPGVGPDGVPSACSVSVPSCGVCRVRVAGGVVKRTVFRAIAVQNCVFSSARAAGDQLSLLQCWPSTVGGAISVARGAMVFSSTGLAFVDHDVAGVPAPLRTFPLVASTAALAVEAAAILNAFRVDADHLR